MFQHKRSRVWLIAGLVILIAGVALVPAIVFAEAKTITGTVAAQGDDIVIKAEDGLYILEGEVEDMVGKKVKATGEVSKNEAGNMVMEVTEIAPVE